MNDTQISFIIPAFNEEKYLPICLSSIKRLFKSYNYEIVVIDNGSTDGTVDIVSKAGANLIVDTTATIAKLRNIGVAHSKGSLLILLDADIELTNSWMKEFISIIDTVKQQRIITGSQAAIPQKGASFIEKNWFQEFYSKEKVTHLGSAHMILNRKTFDEINGFDETMETGEDFDFCQRAKKMGVPIKNNLKLIAIHHGFPKTLYAFMKRESWHGKSDFSSLKSVVNSKVAIITLLFLFFHLTTIWAILDKNEIGVFFSLSVIFILVLLATLVKYSHSKVNQIIVNFFIFYFYFIGRVFSIYRSLTEDRVG